MEIRALRQAWKRGACRHRCPTPPPLPELTTAGKFTVILEKGGWDLLAQVPDWRSFYDPWILFWQMYQDRSPGLLEWTSAQIRTEVGHLPELVPDP